MCQSLILLGSAPWKRLLARTQAPTSIGGSTSGRVAGIVSVAVGGGATGGGGGIGGGGAGGGGVAAGIAAGAGGGGAASTGGGVCARATPAPRADAATAVKT